MKNKIIFYTCIAIYVLGMSFVTGKFFQQRSQFKKEIGAARDSLRACMEAKTDTIIRERIIGVDTAGLIKYYYSSRPKAPVRPIIVPCDTTKPGVIVLSNDTCIEDYPNPEYVTITDTMDRPHFYIRYRIGLWGWLESFKILADSVKTQDTTFNHTITFTETKKVHKSQLLLYFQPGGPASPFGCERASGGLEFIHKKGIGVGGGYGYDWIRKGGYWEGKILLRLL